MLPWKRLLFVVLLVSGAAAHAEGPTAEQLQQLRQMTPEQLQQLQQMTPEQRAALAQQVSGGGGQAKSKEITNPATVQPRNVGAGPLEKDIKSSSQDIKPANIEVGNSVKVDMPVVEQVATQQSADKLEVRRAFEEFTRESKTMVVNTDNLQQFGYELFAGDPSTFAPVTDVPVPSDYVMGPGDEIKVQLTGREAKDLTLTVDREGAVAFPEIGSIVLAGLDFAAAKEMLSVLIERNMIGATASITMGKLRSIRIFALGDVFRPGSYTVSGLATLSHALFASGGVKKIGSLRNIELKRGGRRVGTIDLYDFLLKGDTSKDVRLLPGDVVFVTPVGKTVAIAGYVLRPAIYELKNEHTVGDILKLAGGLLPDAYIDKALIERFSSVGDKEVVNVGLKGVGLAVPVQNGDVIKVFPTTEFESNQVLLIGNVKRPGKLAWREGMRVLDVIRSRDDLLPESLMDYGIIEREADDNREPMVLRFRLDKLMEKGSNADAGFNIELKSRDRIYVFQRANFREQPKLSIAGSVKSPGQYEFKRNMRLADLVLAAGGVQRETDFGMVEIYRTDPSSKEVSLLKVNLARAMDSNPQDDLLLQDLDRVVIHSVYEKKFREEISVMGEVHKPSTISLAQGMRVSDLVTAAGGFTETAFLARAEITRYAVENGEKRSSKHIEIDLTAAMKGVEQSNILLEPYDVLMVRRLTNWRPAEQIEIAGEVMHPGSYPAEEGERLSDLLQRVGGFTEDAYLPAAVFVRESIRVAQQKQLDDLVQRMEAEVAQVSVSAGALRDETLRLHRQEGIDKSNKLLAQLKEVRATGRMVIELDDAAKLRGGFQDITLRAGDKLFVPKRPDEVTVLGEVYNQIAMLFNPRLSRDEYVRQAGPTRMADMDAIYVVRANGLVETSNSSGWFSSSGNVGPGDTVIVPLQLDHMNYLDMALDWSRAMMQIGVSIAAGKAVGVFK